MDKQYTSDNKFYIVLTIAVLALIVGVTGLIIGLQRPGSDSLAPGGDMNAAKQLPPGATGEIRSTEDDPAAGNGVVESPKKN